MPSLAKNKPFDWQKDAQKAMEQAGNPSSIIPNALSALQNLKKIQGGQNPTAIQAIGASNYQAILKQSGSWFATQGNANTLQSNNIIYDCNTLIHTANNLLSNDELQQKAVCLLLQTELELEANGANAYLLGSNGIPTPSELFANVDTGLSDAMNLFLDNIAQMANSINANLSGNTVIAGNLLFSNTALAGNLLFSNTGISGTVSGGVDAISYNAGTISSGTYIPDPHNGEFQHYINGGAHILSPPANVCSMVVECKNQTAGIISFNGFSVITGDVYSSSGTKVHIFFITKTKNYSHLSVLYITGT